VIKRVEPLGSAKYVAFTTLLRPKEMPGQRSNVLEWPYVEGLRLDEAMHPLTILAVGLYGKTCSTRTARHQARRALEIRVQEHQVRRADPVHREAAADLLEPVGVSGVRLLREREPGGESSALEPGPRAADREFFRRPTLMFNGYGDQVASLYAGMDLKKHY